MMFLSDRHGVNSPVGRSAFRMWQPQVLCLSSFSLGLPHHASIYELSGPSYLYVLPVC